MMSRLTATAALFCSFILVSTSAAGSEKDVLHALLNAFLEGVDTIEAHERFWADDLVYTSSNGSRTDKGEILAGMRAAVGQNEAGDAPTYSAEDVDIRLYGTTAIVAFRLVASAPGDDETASNYLNTGTFLKRNGQWQVVAWQATRVPVESELP